MIFIITVITTLILTAAVETLKPLQYKSPPNHEEIDQILNLLTGISSRRAVDQAKLSLARQIYKRLKKSRLRDGAEATPNVEQAVQAEKELKSTLKQTKAVIQKPRPFLESKGKNDFLVMSIDNRDKFATVIPNNIYYNVEKKCVNWLDDCSLKGIRQRLLRGVQSP